MHAKHPKIAARWDKETGGKVAGYAKPKKSVAKGEPSPTGKKTGSMAGRFGKGKAPASAVKARKASMAKGPRRAGK